MGQWGLKGSRDGPSYEELVETEGRPRLRPWLDRIQTDAIAEFAVVYGYWPCYSEGNDLVVLRPGAEVADPGAELHRLHLPAADAGPVPVPGRLLPRSRAGGSSRDPTSWHSTLSRWDRRSRR